MRIEIHPFTVRVGARLIKTGKILVVAESSKEFLSNEIETLRIQLQHENPTFDISVHLDCEKLAEFEYLDVNSLFPTKMLKDSEIQ